MFNGNYIVENINMSMFLRKDLLMEILLSFLVVRESRVLNERIQNSFSYGHGRCYWPST